MLLMYEILREAGVRMPRAVGKAMSVVGALVLGQAAVEAGVNANICSSTISSFYTNYCIVSTMNKRFYYRVIAYLLYI